MNRYGFLEEKVLPWILDEEALKISWKSKSEEKEKKK